MIGVGSIIFLYVNDGGFWFFKEYFNLSVKEILCFWIVMEIGIFIVGIIGILFLE